MYIFIHTVCNFHYKTNIEILTWIPELAPSQSQQNTAEIRGISLYSVTILPRIPQTFRYLSFPMAILLAT